MDPATRAASSEMLTRIQRLSSHLSQHYKYILISSFFGGSFLLFFYNNVNNQMPINNFISDESTILLSNKSLGNPYMIKTPGCTIPMMEPVQDDVKKYVHTPNVESCTIKWPLPLLGKNKTHLWVIPERLQQLSLGENEFLECCYRPFYRPKSIDDIDSTSLDQRVEYHPCTIMTHVFKVEHEFVHVTCQLNNVTLYKDYFLFPRLKNFNREVWKRQENDNKYNVVVLGLDAMSRMNVHRTMPRTLNYLNTRGAIELVGYNKVGDNTFSNLIPVLMGMEDNDLTTSCLPRSRATFDNCPLVWNWYDKKGYVTGFAEDSASLGTFNYLRNGFASTPTDYYLYTFMNEAEQHIGNNNQGNAPLCMGANYFYQILLDYVSDWIEELQSYQIFGFFWEVSMSHDYLNYPMVMDQSYITFFKRMDNIGRVNDTVFVVMSDHGMRWGGIVTTKQGRLEERLPFVSILLPPDFRRQFPLATNNLLRNTRQLTTPHDMHQTLLDLVDPQESLTDLNITARQQTSTSGRGISLFLAVPENRTCETAAIPEHWCTCHRRKQIDISEPAVKAAVASLVNHLNFLLEPFHKCAPLKLSAVREANEVEMSASALHGVTTEVTQREIQLVISVSPSDALLDASLRYEGGIWNNVGPVSRLNLYGDQSVCVKDHYIKLFCYCM